MNATTITMEAYKEAIGRRDFTDVEKAIMLNSAYAEAYLQGASEGLAMCADKTKEEIKELFNDARKICDDELVISGIDSDHAQAALSEELNKFGIDRPQDIDWLHCARESIEVMIQLLSENLNIQ